MLHKIKNRKSEGFTIIEVLIVLAIAALILLIVFLAVPALQRSSRNTQRKNDAAGALGAVNEYVTNNGGVLPTHANGTTTLNLCNNATCSGTDAQSQAKLGYYTGGVATSPTKNEVTIYTSYTAPGTAIDALIIEEGATCASATSAQAGSARAVAAVYGIEASGKYVWQCTGS